MGFWYIENKHTLYRLESCMKKFCTSFREHATNIINFKKKKMFWLTKKRTKTAPGCDSMLYLWKKILKKVC